MSSDTSPDQALRGVEGDHAERVRILPAEEIADDGLEVGLGGGRLHKSQAVS
jgi:hypothetical protein